ncbi:uncharacterized protein G2W53_041212 [Senna tora]|uniref:Uncharacterized protein n=1 Tax=Senna tora TaxID=362788 RepID=A0A834W152_9FABA|nr:uncharacterized protein G2W53_041212 [Senna tora]
MLAVANDPETTIGSLQRVPFTLCTFCYGEHPSVKVILAVVRRGQGVNRFVRLTAVNTRQRATQ